MIFDSLRNARLYSSLGERFQNAFKFLEEIDVKNLKQGKVEISDGVYASVQSYETKPKEECRLETHRKYADIQYVVCGEEAFGFSHLTDNSLKADGPFDEVKDVVSYEGEGIWLPLKAGYFVIVFPEDAHAPRANLNKASEVTKVVAKVLL
jgi:YhcH/YjgK/YiaL family protein